jgi:uncharacterized protein Yka (UPF0111/DUF47 family)
LSETQKLLQTLIPFSEKLVEMSDSLSTLSKVFCGEDRAQTQRILREITGTEEAIDRDFEDIATRIMEVEFLNINPDYLLDVAKHLDLISDLLERTALLFEYLGEFRDTEVMELLTTPTAEINQITRGFVSCLKAISTDRKEVERICAEISEREKVVDGVRERFNAFAIQKMGLSEYRIWLKDIFGHLDQIADLSRDLSITFRVIASKLERQRLLNVKGSPKSPDRKKLAAL